MMISVALVLAMGCGKEEAPKPQEQAKALVKSEDQKPGSVLWEFETGDIVNSSPAIGSDGTVYVGSYDNKLYAINENGRANV